MTDDIGSKWSLTSKGSVQKLNEKTIHPMRGSSITALDVAKASLALVSRYAFSGNGNDSEGSAHLSAGTAPTTVDSGTYGQADDYEASSSQYREAGNTTDHDLGTGDLWGSFYWTPEVVNALMVICGKRDSAVATNLGWAVRQSAAGKIELMISDGTSVTTVTGNSTLVAGTRYWIVWKLDRSGNGTIHIDATQDGSGDITSQNGTASNSVEFRVGSKGGTAGDYADGIIDHLQIGTTLPTDDQIKQMYTDLHAGMLVKATTTEGGFMKDIVYQRDAENVRWYRLRRDTGAPLIRVVARNKLDAAGDTLTVENIPACENMLVLIRKEAATAADVRLRFNGDDGANYATRQSADGGADGTTASDTELVITQNNNTLPSFSVIEISNRANEEKIVTALDISQNTAGAATAPGRGQVVGKWSNISEKISSITLTNGAAGDYGIGTEIIVLAESTDEAYEDFWEELGSTELGSAADDIDETSFAAKKYLMIQAHLIASGNIGGLLTFNDDSGSNYARRTAADGAADGTATAQASINLLATAATAFDVFAVIHVINIADREKLVIMQAWRPNTAGDANAPIRFEGVFKWVNTTDQITRVDINNNGTGSFDTGSILKVWGHD